MNLPEEFAKLANRLVQLSNEDKVKWNKPKIGDGFTLSTEKAEIEIYPWSDHDQEKHYYQFNFESGNASNGFKVSNWDFGYDTLEELYNAASRNAQEIRNKIDDFLSDFD